MNRLTKATSTRTTLLALVAAACATLPKPEALTVAEEQESLSTVEEASELAPQAFAHAVQLRKRAEGAHEDGDRERAQILAEHALAAYQRALVQARLVKAKTRIEAAERSVEEAETELVRLTQAQQRAEAEAKALELRARVVRDAEPLEPIDNASPAREAARREAALSIVEVARLLCLASRMLDAKAEGPEKLQGELDALSKKLRGGERPTPIDEAMRLRARCLETLTLTRRTARQASPETDPADVLFTELASALPDSKPIRDDRGVVLAASDMFTNGAVKLTPSGQSTVEKIAKIAKANDAFPLLIVLHGPASRTGPQQAELERELSRQGARAKFHQAGTHVPRTVGTAQEADERVEFVLVAPQ